MLRKSDRVTDLLLGFTCDSRKNRLVFTQPRYEIAAANPKSLDPEKEVVDGGKARESMRPASETATPSPVSLCICDLDTKSHTAQESDPRRKSLTKQTICLKNLLQGRKQKERLTDRGGGGKTNKSELSGPFISSAHANDDAMAARSEHRDGQTYCADAKLNLTQLRIHFVSRRSERQK